MLTDERTKKIASLNKSYCPLLFKEIYASMAGKYKVCCHSNESTGILSETPPFEFFLSEEMEKIREDVFNNKEISHCSSCYEKEKLSGWSPRLERIKNTTSYLDFSTENITVNVRMFSSYCNLSCYMCHPVNSSTKRKEINSIKLNTDNTDLSKKLDHWGNGFKVATNMKLYKNLKLDILNNIEKVGKLQFMGGEPLLSTYTWDLLDSIDEKYAENIGLIFVTNLTSFGIKDYHALKSLSKFKHIFFSISCDHYGEKLKWIRYPIDVENFENNLKELMKVKESTPNWKYDFKMSGTTSILNIEDLYEIKDYYENMGVPKFTWTNNIVEDPTWLSIRNLPQSLKNEYILKYEKLPIVISELKKDIKEELLENGLEYCDMLSKHRGFDYKIIWKDFLNKLNT